MTDEDKIKNAIDVYFKLRYEGQKLLEAQNFSFLIANDPQTQAWAQREKDKREVELYNAATYRLNYVGSLGLCMVGVPRGEFFTTDYTDYTDFFIFRVNSRYSRLILARPCEIPKSLTGL